MKKLMMPALIVFFVACANPEDRATGNEDSTRFNAQERNNLNTATELDNKNTEQGDTSKSPATSKQNANSETSGTNRTYGGGEDSTRK
jgi:hypothetical protein